MLEFFSKQQHVYEFLDLGLGPIIDVGILGQLSAFYYYALFLP
jgi:hypothetical protein